MNLTKQTKTAFKRLHAGGELVLLAGGVRGDAVAVAALIQAKLDDGVNLLDYGKNTTSHGFIDNSEHQVFESEENSLIFLENSWVNNLGETVSYTTVYGVR